MVGLAVAAGVARDPRTQRAVIMAVIMAAAAVTALRENQQRSVARLAAWDKRQAEKGGGRGEGAGHPQGPAGQSGPLTTCAMTRL